MSSQLAAFRHATPEGADRGDRAAMVEAAGSVWDAPDLARVPKGFRAAPEWEPLLRRKHVTLRTKAAPPHPEWLFTSAARTEIERIPAALNPIAQYLRGFC